MYCGFAGIYINDLLDLVDKFTLVFLFADDTKLFRHIQSSADVLILQSDIQKLSAWSKQWLLRFHPDKCVAMNLGNREHIISGYAYTLDGKIFEKTRWKARHFLSVDDGLNL